MMIVLVAIMHALPEKQKEVLQTLLSMVESPEKEKGCLSYGVSCDIRENTVFYLISKWETRKNLDHYIKSNRFSILLGIKSILYEPMKIQIFTVSASEGIEAVDFLRNNCS